MTEWENGDEKYWKAINRNGTIGNIDVYEKDVNARSPNGLTPLHLAAMYSDKPEVIETLIEKGANINARDKLGRAPLHFAAEDNQNPKIVEALLEKRTNPDPRDKEGNTPLHRAASSESINSDVIMALLNNGADGTLQDEDRKIPFDYAKENELLKDTEAYWALNESYWDSKE